MCLSRALLNHANHRRHPDPQVAPITLAKIQDPLKKTMDAAQNDLKPIYSGLNKYGKALDKVRFFPKSHTKHTMTDP